MAINTLTFLRLIAWCSALPLSTHQRSINHQALIFSISEGKVGPVLFFLILLSFYLRTFIVLCSFHFVSISSHLCARTHTHTHEHCLCKYKKDKTRNASINEGFWSIPQGLCRWIMYICVRYQGMNRNPSWSWEMTFTFQLIFQLTKSFPFHSLKPVESKWNWPPCPESISLILTPSHQASIVDQPST